MPTSRSATASLLGFLLVLAACSPAESETIAGPTVTTAPSSTMTTTVATVPPATLDPGEPVDRLLIVDKDGNLVTTDRAGGSVETITSDAGTNVGYFQPTWSPDAGSVVVSRFSNGGFSLVDFNLAAGTEASLPTDNNPFYVYWSPTGGRLGYLATGANGMALSIAEFGEEPTSDRIELGAPFYFSWSPNGDQLATLIGGERLELRDVLAGGQPRDIADPGSFLNPAWTSDGLFYIARIAGTDSLVVGEPGGAIEVLARSIGTATFTVPASGARVAIQTVGDAGGISAAYQEVPLLPLNQLVVVERATGEVSTVSEEPVLAFFWDRAGEQLLLLEADSQTGLFHWSVWAAGELRSFAEFFPARVWVETYLPFFSQYALSTTMWAPDGTAFVFAGNFENEPGIYVQDVSGGDPVKVFEGGWVSWSPR